MLAHSVGAVEIAVGRWDGDVLRLRSSTVHTSPSAKRVTALERDIALHDDTMEYTLRMSTGDESPRWHLSADLQRSRGGTPARRAQRARQRLACDRALNTGHARRH